jgi:hypothetical protein
VENLRNSLRRRSKTLGRKIGSRSDRDPLFAPHGLNKLPDTILDQADTVMPNIAQNYMPNNSQSDTILKGGGWSRGELTRTELTVTEKKRGNLRGSRWKTVPFSFGGL